MGSRRAQPATASSALRLGLALLLALGLHAGIALGVLALAPPAGSVRPRPAPPIEVALIVRAAERPPAPQTPASETTPVAPSGRALPARPDAVRDRDAPAPPYEVLDDVDAPTPPPAAPPPLVVLDLRRPRSPAPAAEPSALERVLAAGSRGLTPGSTLLERQLEQPDTLAQLLVPPRAQAGARAQEGDILRQLTPTDDGGYSYQGPQIHAEIFADGSVLLYDPPHLRAQLLGVPVERLPELLKDPRAELRRAVRARRAQLEARGANQGLPVTDEVKDALAVLNLLLTGTSIGGVFDITESAMRAVGEDPFASAKVCFLDETEALRERLRSQHLAQVQRRALDGLHAHLCAVWADTSRPAVERRATLFELWDECEDSEAGREARDIIVAFVQQTLPASSADAFGAVELLALNARRTSHQLFEPYTRRLP